MPKITPIINKIESLADQFHSLSDVEMREYTKKLKARLAEGETLDDILPEAFALVREADERVLGKRPFKVQLIGGILLHQGRIAEMVSRKSEERRSTFEDASGIAKYRLKKTSTERKLAEVEDNMTRINDIFLEVYIFYSIS